MFSPKFYWFDIGVKRTLEEALDYPPAPGTSYFGDCFESLVVNEVFRLNSYFETKFRLSYLATSNSDVEVDLVLDKGRGRELVLIEIKSSTSLDEVEIKKLAKVSSSFKNAKSYYLSLTEESEIRHGVRCFHWQKGLQEIFGVGSKSPEE